MVRAKALTDAEIARGVGRTKPIASKSVLEQSRSGPGSRGLTVVNATDNKNYIIPKALVRELSRTWDQVLAAKDTGFITIDDAPLAVQFVLEWMKCGGCDNPATNALQYPAGSQKKLDCLGRLAGRLGIDELVKRVNTDLETIKATALKAHTADTAPPAAQAQQVGHGRRDAGKPALEANDPGATRQAPQGHQAKRDKATPNEKRVPHAVKEDKNIHGRQPKDGKRQPKKRSCKKCGDPRHYQSKCPVGWSDATDGAWKFVPRRPRPFPIKAGAVGDEVGTAAEGKRMTRQPPEPLEHTAGDIDNFQLMDQNGITWFVPWYKLKVRFETVPGSGKVRMIGDAPLEYSWIPADIAGDNGAIPDSDSSHKA